MIILQEIVPPSGGGTAGYGGGPNYGQKGYGGGEASRYMPVRSVKLSALSCVGSLLSEFNYRIQTQDWGGDRWLAYSSFPPLKRATFEPWLCFLLSLRGMNGTFYVGDPSAARPRGSAMGGPRVSLSVLPRSKSIPTYGWMPNHSGVLLPGDYVQAGFGGMQRIYKILTQVNADANGEATLEVFPSIREPIAQGDRLEMANTKGVFRLATNQLDWEIDTAGIYNLSFNATEAL